MEVWKALHVSAYISIKVWFKEHTILKKKNAAQCVSLQL